MTKQRLNLKTTEILDYMRANPNRIITNRELCAQFDLYSGNVSNAINTLSRRHRQLSWAHRGQYVWTEPAPAVRAAQPLPEEAAPTPSEITGILTHIADKLQAVADAINRQTETLTRDGITFK